MVPGTGPSLPTNLTASITESQRMRPWHVPNRCGPDLEDRGGGRVARMATRVRVAKTGRVLDSVLAGFGCGAAGLVFRPEIENDSQLITVVENGAKRRSRSCCCCDWPHVPEVLGGQKSRFSMTSFVGWSTGWHPDLDPSPCQGNRSNTALHGPGNLSPSLLSAGQLSCRKWRRWRLQSTVAGGGWGVLLQEHLLLPM